MEQHPFEPGQLIFGGLVPWRGEWYWSGEQQLLGNAAEVDVEDLKRTMKRQSSHIVCRYCKEYEDQVRRLSAIQIERMFASYGTDLIVYPDGLSMAADWENKARRQWESEPIDVRERAAKKHGLKRGRPEVTLPPDLLQIDDGIGAFINPDEGMEIMPHFTCLSEGLKRQGAALTENEGHAIRGFVQSPAISPRFVQRVLAEYGAESVKAAFVLQGDVPHYWLTYLLRSHKGDYFRKRYPSLSVL